jgi:hypothetical protein
MKGTLDIAVDADDELGNGSVMILCWSRKEGASRIGIGNGYKDALGLKAYKGSNTSITSHFSERSSITTASKTVLHFSTSC